MPFQNHITENDLKAYMPELSRLLWADEADYSRQKNEAEKLVLQDLLDRGYKGVNVMPELILRQSGNVIGSDEFAQVSTEDFISRLRFAYTVTEFTSDDSKTITLEGSNDKSAWEIIKTINITGTGSSSVIIGRQYRFYRVYASVTGGQMDYKAWLIETTFDRFLSFKWLELILLDRYTEENDQYYLKMLYFKNEYDTLWNKVRIWSDINEDGTVSENESGKTSSIKMLK
jgi:hypothetical protein